MANNDVVSTLNDLIETCKDGEEGFRKCANDISAPDLKQMFMDRAQTCAASAQELQQCVRAYGGDPETSSSVSGSLHRRWVDIKTAVTGNTDQATLEEIERGEDVALESYRNALSKELPADVRAIVEKQYEGVKKNHDQVRRLRDQARAQG